MDMTWKNEYNIEIKFHLTEYYAKVFPDNVNIVLNVCVSLLKRLVLEQFFKPVCLTKKKK
jgi:hypothetical protein